MTFTYSGVARVWRYGVDTTGLGTKVFGWIQFVADKRTFEAKIEQ